MKGSTGAPFRSPRVGWVPRREGEQPWLTRLPRRPVVRDRNAWLVDAARGRRVAHVGFADVGCELTHRERGRWLHAQLADAASSIVGLDVTADAVEAACAEGYEAYAVDCTSLEDLRALELQPFDRVVVGEVIEHVDDPGGLLQAVGQLVRGGGDIVLTTPNARRFVDLVLALTGREVIHPDHVAIYSARTLTALLERHGWRVTELRTYLVATPPAPRGLKEAALRTVNLVGRLLASTSSPWVADGLIVVAVRAAREEPR